jgi:hypothetical protein
LTELPKLKNWLDTRLGLHRAAQVIGGVRKVVAEPEPNWAHLGLQVIPEGVTTGVLPKVGTLTLNFGQRAIIHSPVQGSPRTILLLGHSQITLADFIDEALAQTGQMVRLDRAKIANRDPFNINETLASEYATVLNWANQLLADYRQSLPGEKSKLVVWPHGFDTSFLWFATPDVSEHAPHMAFGFSPGSEGIERPYFYAYAHPNPDSLVNTPLSVPAKWHREGWTGLVLDYDALTDQADQQVKAAFDAVYGAASPHLEQAENSR